jgi:2-amino-4-hydroxy-6-hydroxymethyldihydropteridine diphosphokinase
MTNVYLGLGSNVDAENHLSLGITELRNRYGDLELSNTYSSRAVGFDGTDFLNLVVSLETDTGPDAVQDAIEEIHRLAGRERGEEKYSARTLDVDLLLYGDLVQQQAAPRLPRPDILEYSFVLRPLAEVAPDVVHPVTGKTISEHWREFDESTQPLTRVELVL